jgi:hypothetical protein
MRQRDALASSHIIGPAVAYLGSPENGSRPDRAQPFRRRGNNRIKKPHSLRRAHIPGLTSNLVFEPPERIQSFKARHADEVLS